MDGWWIESFSYCGRLCDTSKYIIVQIVDIIKQHWRYELRFVHSPSNPQHPSCLVMFRYVKLHVLPDKNSKMKTAVKKNTTHPVYNEVLKVKRKEEIHYMCFWTVLNEMFIHVLCFAVSDKSPSAGRKKTAGLCLAFKDPETEDISGRSPHPAGWLEVWGQGLPELQLVSTLSKGKAQQRRVTNVSQIKKSYL